MSKVSKIFKMFKTEVLIAVLEDDATDCFFYYEIMDELHLRSRNNDTQAFHFLVGTLPLKEESDYESEQSA